MNQRHSLESSRERLAALDDANASLQADINRLKTKSGIAQAAREELGVVRKGEKVEVVTPKGVVKYEITAISRA